MILLLLLLLLSLSPSQTEIMSLVLHLLLLQLLFGAVSTWPCTIIVIISFMTVKQYFLF